MYVLMCWYGISSGGGIMYVATLCCCNKWTEIDIIYIHRLHEWFDVVVLVCIWLHSVHCIVRTLHQILHVLCTNDDYDIGVHIQCI